MTLWAVREDNYVKVQCTYGSVVFSVNEDPAHARHFWGQLGKVLDDLDKQPGEIVNEVAG